MSIKKQIINRMRIDEISAVDRPAQTGCVAVIMKRGETVEEVSYTTICKNAGAVSEGGQPAYTRHAYEDAMAFRSEALAKNERISPEQAFAKYHGSDQTLRALAQAAEMASYHAYAVRVNGGSAAAA